MKTRSIEAMSSSLMFYQSSVKGAAGPRNQITPTTQKATPAGWLFAFAGFCTDELCIEGSTIAARSRIIPKALRPVSPGIRSLSLS